jgi:chromosome segregation ATPase
MSQAVELAILSGASLEDETLSVRKTINDGSLHILRLVDELKARCDDNAKELEQKLSEAAKELGQAKSRVTSLESQLAAAKTVADQSEKSAELAEKLAGAQSQAKAFEDALESARKDVYVLGAKNAELEKALKLRVKSCEDAEAREAELKALVQDQGRTIQEEAAARMIAEEKLESANKMIAFYKGKLEEAQRNAQR